ncbi:MAG TPA: hypothetical protein VKR31_08715 [Rhizomicrobium sp.]|nr:hypothetical protein [Rhizomicrobium sp.]
MPGKLDVTFAVALLLSAATSPIASWAADGGAIKPTPPHATATSASCGSVTANWDTIFETVFLDTESTSWTDIPYGEGVVTFNEKEAGGCILVMLDGDAITTTEYGLMYVQALLDGNVMVPGAVAFAGGLANSNSDGPINARAASWVATGVPSGRHTVQLQWKSYNGEEVDLGYPATVVWHK